MDRSHRSWLDIGCQRPVGCSEVEGIGMLTIGPFEMANSTIQTIWTSYQLSQDVQCAGVSLPSSCLAPSGFNLYVPWFVDREE